MAKMLLTLCLIQASVSAQENNIMWLSKPKTEHADSHKATYYNQQPEHDLRMHQEISDALASLHGFVNSGRFERLIHLLKSNTKIEVVVLPPDSVSDENINSSKINRNKYDRCVLNVLRYAQIRGLDRDGGCKSLLVAAQIAFRELDKPHLALAIYELACVSGYTEAIVLKKKMEHYIKYDLTHLSLLNVSWFEKTNKEKLVYIAHLMDVLKKNPESLLLLKFSIHIGDVYYSMARYRQMIRWYKKAVSLESTIAKKTAVGYRMESGKKILFREFIIITIYSIYGIILLIIVLSFYHFRLFQIIPFLRRAMVIVPGFILVGAGIIILDFAISSGTIASILNKSEINFAKPTVPFSVMDFSCMADLIIILLLGLLPVVVSLVYTSFADKKARKNLIFILPLLIVSTWGHYILTRLYDDAFEKLAVTTGTHLYFDGELEIMLLENPTKVLRANPEIFHSNNKSLEDFVMENNPSLILHDK